MLRVGGMPRRCLAAATVLALLAGSAAARDIDPRLLPPYTLTRAAWGAQPARDGELPRRVRRLTVHRTESPTCPGSPDRMDATLRAVQRHHQRDEGWT